MIVSDPLQLLLFGVAVLVTGVSKSGFAGGLGVVSVPILSLTMSPLLAIALMLPTLLLMDLLSVRAWWGKFNVHLLKVIVPAGVIGVIAGYFAFSIIDEKQVKFVLGLITLVFGLNGLVKLKSSFQFSDNAGRLLSVTSGFTSFVAHAGGPPLNIYLLSKNLDKQSYLGTAVVFFAAINLVKVPPYLSIGLFTDDNVLMALAFSPIAFAGIKLGVWLQGKINEQVFFKLIYSLMIVVGVVLVGLV